MQKKYILIETSDKLAVNNALRALQDAKNKAVKLGYSLYVEVIYPLNESDYSSGIAYKNAVTTGKHYLIVKD